MFDLLIRNIHLPFPDLPPYVKAYMQDNAVLPDWADQAKLAQASQLFLDMGLHFSMVLLYKSLPECYLIASDVDVLYATGRLSGRKWPETYARRVGETTQFVIDVMGANALQPNGIGMETLLRVRLVHASIRHFLMALPDQTQFGIAPPSLLPINQRALAYTLMTFGLTMPAGLQQMGIALTQQQKEAFFHHWLVAGRIMGIELETLPKDIAEGKELMDRISDRWGAESEGGRACTAALITFLEDILRGEALDKLPKGLVRHFNGDRVADLLGVERPSGCMAKLFPNVLLKMIGFPERIEDKYPELAPFSNKVGAAVLRGMRKYFNSYKGHGLRVPPEMENSWKI